ncbi:response regulator transcription factor [Campylobacter californiensis]|uniref:response regulator transcription factor n=1 Tax=Campylobacter californiensis TaxID=1032243 RepID=UPI001D1384C4|nr:MULTISPECIES: response regulator transcription factor [unclassified Campylobacter]
MIEILLIEDDFDLAELLKYALAKSEIDVTIATNPLEGLKILNEKNTFDALVLDLGLPDMDGLEVCKKVRYGYPALPIVISSARTETLDKIKGFELGADDYMAKPYDPIELVFRIRSILRRGIQITSDSKTFCVDKQRRIVIKNKEEIALTKAEFDIFIYFYEKEGMVIPREDILINLGQSKFQSGLKSIDVAIGRLRQKIGDDSKNPRYIHPVRGIGYKFINA